MTVKIHEFGCNAIINKYNTHNRTINCVFNAVIKASIFSLTHVDVNNNKHRIITYYLTLITRALI